MKNKKIKIISVISLIALIFTFISCDEYNLNSENLSRELTKKDSYWFIYQKGNNRYKNSQKCYKFYPDGKCFYMIYNPILDTIEKYETYDIVFPDEWTYSERDSILNSNGYKCKILSLKKDTIILEIKLNTIEMLINHPEKY